MKINLIFALGVMQLSLFAKEYNLEKYNNEVLKANDSALQVQPTKELSREELLNRSMLSKELVDYDAKPIKFLSEVPIAGTYPRIFSNRSEYPTIKENLLASSEGKELLAHNENELNLTAQGKGRWGKSYLALQNNKMAEFDRRHIHKVAAILAQKAFLADLFGRENEAKETGTLAHRLAIYTETTAKKSDNMFDVPNILDSLGMIQMLDFSLAKMATQQREEILQILEKHYDFILMQGVELPSSWRRWNHIPMRFSVALGHFLLEGRKKYDKRFDQRNQEVLSDYFTYCYTPEGTSTEGLVYTLGRVPDAIMLMEAMGKRNGKNYFNHPHYQKIAQWCTYALAPNPDNLWVTGGDTGTFAEPPWEMLGVMQFFAPQDELIQYNYAHAYPKKFNDIASVYTLSRFASPKRDKVTVPANLPTSQFDVERGILNSRTAWDNGNATQFRMEARHDTFFPSHDHSDRGHFTLASHGRYWIVDEWRSCQSEHHNVFTIDGVGQGYFPTPAEWLKMISNDIGDFGAINQKYNYDYMWLKSPTADSMLGEKQPEKWDFYVGIGEKLKKYYPNQKPERDPLKKVAEFYQDKLAGNPLFWAEDTWPMRLKHNIVDYAFRTFAFVKGEYPYVLIIDDIKKDNQNRLYEVALPMLADVELIDSRHLAKVTTDNPKDIGVYLIDDRRKFGDYELLLGDSTMNRNKDGAKLIVGGNQKTGLWKAQKGNPLLLVRVLDYREPLDPKMSVLPRLETYSKVKTDDMHQFYLRSMGIGKRLVMGTRADEANFKMLIYPHNSGDVVPETIWSDDRTELEVKFPNQIDRFEFKKAENSKTIVTMYRNNKEVVKF